MRRYETIVILRPSVGEDDIKDITGKYADIIKKNSGETIKEDHWEIKTLAYPIKKEQQGYYICLEYAALPEAVFGIERLAKLDDRHLKYMTVKLQDVYVPDEEFPDSESPAADAAGGFEGNEETGEKITTI